MLLQVYHNDYHGTSVESFFKVARLDKGSTLVVRQQSSGHYPSPCGVTHVRLIPLTPEEIERISAERTDRSHRTAAATCDGFSFIFHRRPTTAEDLLSEVEILPTRRTCTRRSGSARLLAVADSVADCSRGSPTARSEQFPTMVDFSRLPWRTSHA